MREGEISKFDVFLSAWSRIIDGANIFPLVFEHFTREERKELARALSYEQYRFSWENATGNYSLNLSNPAQYNVMLQLAAINTVESEFAKARRGDTR